MLEITGKPYTWEEVESEIRQVDPEFLEYMDGVRASQIEQHGVDYTPDQMLSSFWANRCDRIQDGMEMKGTYLVQYVSSEFADMETDWYANLQHALARLAVLVEEHPMSGFAASITYQREKDGELFHICNYINQQWQFEKSQYPEI